MWRLLWLLVVLATGGCRAQEVRYEQHALTVEGHSWTYYDSAPKRPEGLLPLVIILPGAGGSGGTYLARAGWGEKARKSGFLAISPSALPVQLDQPADFAKNPRIWNATGELSGERGKVEDWPFFEALLRDISTHWKIDSHRIYCVGHSNGGTMTYALARRWPERWAAIATVAAPPLSEPLSRLSRPVPTLVLLGGADKVMPVAGGEGQTPWGTRKFPSAQSAAVAWAGSLAIAHPEAVAWTGSSMLYSPIFEVRVLSGQGHAWPGWQGSTIELFGPTRSDLSGADLVWEFLSKFKLP